MTAINLKQCVMATSCVMAMTACQGGNAQLHDEQVTIDPSWTERIMPCKGGGITGGDGSISIDLKNGRSLFLWGDSFIGDVVDDSRAKDSKLIVGNTFTTIDDNGHIRTYFSGTRNNPSAFLQPQKRKGCVNWYWPGNGCVSNGILHLFMSEFERTGTGTFAFKYVGCDYFRMDPNTLNVISKEHFNDPDINGVHYGHAVLQDGNYVYVYGTKTDSLGVKASVHVARGILKDNRLQSWSYWDGTKWQDDPLRSSPLRGIRTSVSEQFNIIKLNGTVVLVTQDRMEDVKNIYSYTSESPSGPFSNCKLLYTVKEKNWDTDKMMTYNTMAHPQYQKDGKILMCYNVNTHDDKKLFIKASLYRPRFFWVPINLILDK